MGERTVRIKNCVPTRYYTAIIVRSIANYYQNAELNPFLSGPIMPPFKSEAEHEEIDISDIVAGSLVGGRYRIIRLVGRGAMGGVYLAQDTLLDQELVALKVFSRGGHVGEDGLERFIREAQIGRRVAHPNVCRVFDLQADNEIIFVSMEYVSGQSLTSRLKQGALPQSLSVSILRQIIEGLTAIHCKGIVHRDLKPSNILLTSGGHVKIIDFGLARMVGSDVTITNALMGTAMYLAPELWDGADPSFSSDMYALGVLAYFMVTGSPPWSQESITELMRAHLDTEPVPPSEVVSVSRDLDELIMRLLDKDPGSRPLCDDPLFAEVLGVVQSPIQLPGLFQQGDEHVDIRSASPLATSPLAVSRVMEPASGVFQQLSQEHSALAGLLLGSVVCAAAITSGWVLQEIQRLFGSSLDSPMTMVGGYAVVVCTCFLIAPTISRGAFRLGLHSNERAVREILQRSMRSIAFLLLVSFFIPVALYSVLFQEISSAVLGAQIVSSILALTIVFPQIIGLFPIQRGVAPVVVGDTLVWAPSNPPSILFTIISDGFLVYWVYLLSGLIRPPKRRITPAESEERIKITSQFVALLATEVALMTIIGSIQDISSLVVEQSAMTFSPIQWIFSLINFTFIFWANVRMRFGFGSLDSWLGKVFR